EMLGQIRAHAEAADLDNQHMTQVGQTFQAYRSLEGKNAADALPRFYDDLNTSRKDYMNKASSPMAKQYLTAELDNRTARYYVYAEEHAAQQEKHYQSDVAKTRIGMFDSEVADNPIDNGVFNRTVENKASAVLADAAQHGRIQPDYQKMDELHKDGA